MHVVVALLLVFFSVVLESIHIASAAVIPNECYTTCETDVTDLLGPLRFDNGVYNCEAVREALACPGDNCHPSDYTDLQTICGLGMCSFDDCNVPIEFVTQTPGGVGAIIITGVLSEELDQVLRLSLHGSLSNIVGIVTSDVIITDVVNVTNSLSLPAHDGTAWHIFYNVMTDTVAQAEQATVNTVLRTYNEVRDEILEHDATLQTASKFSTSLSVEFIMLTPGTLLRLDEDYDYNLLEYSSASSSRLLLLSGTRNWNSSSPLWTCHCLLLVVTATLLVLAGW